MWLIVIQGVKIVELIHGNKKPPPFRTAIDLLKFYQGNMSYVNHFVAR